MKLALDFGTTTGFALFDRTGDLVSWGAWELAVLERRGGAVRRRGSKADKTAAKDAARAYEPRVRALADFLKWQDSQCAAEGDHLTHVAFEDVKFATSAAQGHLWASLRTAAWLALGRDVVWQCEDVGTLKKFATGRGNALKPDMLAALPLELKKRAAREKLDDNAVDAWWVGRFFHFDTELASSKELEDFLS